MGVLTWSGGMVPLLVWTQLSTTLGNFVTLWLIRDPLEAVVLDSKTSSLDGKVRYGTL